MCTEVDLVASTLFDQYHVNPIAFHQFAGTAHHETIFSQTIYTGTFTKQTTLSSNPSPIETKIRKSAVLCNIAPRGGSAEVGIKAKWGGESGGEVSGYVKGQYEDDKGNYAKIEVEQNSDGTGSATAAAGHKKD